MFRSVFTKSLREYRWAILGWGIGLGILIYANYATFSQIFNSPSSATQLQQLAEQFRFFGEPIKLDTAEGYTTFRAMGVVPVLLGIWAVLAGARLVRGEEERGSFDVVLATPQPRVRIMAQKVLALVTAIALIVVLIAIWTVAGMASANVTVDLGAALLAGLNVGLTALVFVGFALLLSQFVGRGAAAGLAGGLMAFFYVLDGAVRATNGAEGIQVLSPFYYYQLSKPLIASYGMNWGALAVLLVLCIFFVGLSVPLFLRRDVNRSVLADAPWRQNRAGEAHRKTSQQVLAEAADNVWVRSIGVQTLRRQGSAIFWWVLALGILSGYFVFVAKAAEQQLAEALGNSPLLRQLFSGADIGTNNGFLAALVFGYLPVVVAVFAGLIAYRWATDLDGGRLELVLSTPPSRWHVILERYAAVLVAAAAMVLVVWLAIVLFAQAAGFTVDVGRVATASVGMLPLELVTASLVFALAGLIPPGAVIGIMSVFLGVSFLAQILKTLLNLPDWALNLSIFHQYGNPLTGGLNWGAFVGMLSVALVLLLVGGWQFSARDVERGAAES